MQEGSEMKKAYEAPRAEFLLQAVDILTSSLTQGAIETEEQLFE